MFYIYTITNTINYKIYVGQTTVPKNRWAAHKCEARSNRIRYPIHFAIQKYGEGNFQFTLVGAYLTQQEVDVAEVYWIEFFDSRNNQVGYNLAIGGNGNSGWHHTKESKRKISQSNLGKEMPLHTQEWKDNMSAIMTGRNITWADKIGLAHRGMKHSTESKKKMSKSQKGNQAGEKHPRAKLTVLIVDSIRKEYAENKITKTALAEKYGVSRTMIANIVKNKNWNV